LSGGWPPGHDVRGAPDPQTRAVGARAPSVEGAEVERVVEGQLIGDERVERTPADERAVRAPGARREHQFVVLDTTPTGHTVLLIIVDAAEADHGEVSRTQGDAPDAVRRLLPRLRDADSPRSCW
jgi:arsenite-transporting ATPase